MSVAGSPAVRDEREKLPDYALELAAFHRAFDDELRAVVNLVPLSADAQVLDVGCGDGFYSILFAERLGAAGRVVGLDVNEALLERARKRSADAPDRAVEFRCDDLQRFATREAGTFDVAWCAQSLYSFPDPTTALRQMHDAVRPGGLVAVLENDTLHQLLMPWPTTMELALRNAERAAFEAETARPGKFYVGRRLPAVLAAAGLEPLGFSTRPIDRVAPLDPVLELFLKSYLQELVARTGPYLEPTVLAELRELVLPEGTRYLPRQPHFTLTWLNVVCWGRRPA